MDIEKIKIKIRESFDAPTSSEDNGRISYSQFSKFVKCPKSWELAYLKNLRTKDPSIHTCFGTSFHETMQEYLTLYLEKSDSHLDYDFPSKLREYMLENYSKDIDNHEHFTTPEELHEFWEDGVAIFEEFRNHKDVYFDPNRYSLLGIEAPIFMRAVNAYDVNMLSFLDIVLYDKLMDLIKIVDIKTSTSGWNKYMREDSLKQSQLVLYKYFFSQHYDVPLEKIDAEFLICKRKLDYGDSRISSFAPPISGDFLNEVNKNLYQFITHCFGNDGSFNLNSNYYAVSGKNNKHCKFCEFKDREDLCPKKERLKEYPN